MRCRILGEDQAGGARLGFARDICKADGISGAENE